MSEAVRDVAPARGKGRGNRDRCVERAGSWRYFVIEEAKADQRIESLERTAL